jgi:hypothetical protein
MQARNGMPSTLTPGFVTQFKMPASRTCSTIKREHPVLRETTQPMNIFYRFLLSWVPAERGPGESSFIMDLPTACFQWRLTHGAYENGDHNGYI